MANLVQNPYPIYTDANGDPVEDGYVFIGEPGLSPITNPLQAYWDSDLSVPAVNIRTKGGYASRSGTPGRLYTATNYSIIVQDKNQQTIYTQLDSVDYVNSASGSLIALVDTIADLRGLALASPDDQASVGGSVTVGDGLMGPLYYWNATSSATDDGVSVIQPTSTIGDGRWLWINTNAPMETVNISSSVTLELDHINKLFLVNTSLGLTLAVPDGDFQGQNIQIANRGVSTLTLTGTGLTVGALIDESATLTWAGTQWSISYKGENVEVQDELFVDTIRELTFQAGVSIEASSGEQLLKKVLSIGDWDMDATPNVGVDHGLDNTKIRSIFVMIIPDVGVSRYPLTYTNQGYFSSGSTQVTLDREAAGFFDGTNFDSTAFNRGYVTITYEA